ncbi:MAG: fibronectin type III domain-containing protein [Patescibacteria group bacterium]
MIRKIFLSLLVSLSFFLNLVVSAEAGTDLTVTCANNGPCSISPADTPLFNESGMMPGDNFTQTLTITNNDSDETCNLLLNATDTTPESSVNLAERMFAAIYSGNTDYFGTQISGVATSDRSYQDLYDTDNISLGSLAPNSTRVFTWNANFDILAGNEFQRSRTVFDFAVRITCDGPSNPGNPGNPGNPPGGNPGSTNTDPAKPPVCEAEVPTSAPSLSVAGAGPNAVTLNWTSVSPVTHYALVFTRISDGASYGSTNIGNTTSYTVTQLSAGQAYSFQIFGVNDCAPGPRSNSAEIPITSGQVLAPDVRPVGQGGQVLGETTDESTQSAQVQPTSQPTGEVAGATSGVCVSWRFYVPWILLILQLLVTMLFDNYFKKKRTQTKHWVAVVIALLSIGLFYWLRQCDCYSGGFWLLVWLCKWYWIVAVLDLLVSRLINYAFIEEVEARKKPANVKEAADKTSGMNQ